VLLLKYVLHIVSLFLSFECFSI
jgi:talin